MSGFEQFLLRGNVVDLAVGVVVGAAFGTVVTAFVKDLLTPLIGIGGWTMTSFSLNGSFGAASISVRRPPPAPDLLDSDCQSSEQIWEDTVRARKFAWTCAHCIKLSRVS